MRSHKRAGRRGLILLSVLASMLFLAPTAGAEDGGSTAALTPEASMICAGHVQAAEGEASVLLLPQALTRIGESAFEGSAAERILISENVIAIEKNAFANCRKLREIHIPPTVEKVDDCALQGCENVMVYGKKGTEAERFADTAGFEFYDPDADYEIPFDPS